MFKLEPTSNLKLSQRTIENTVVKYHITNVNITTAMNSVPDDGGRLEGDAHRGDDRSVCGGIVGEVGYIHAEATLRSITSLQL